MTQNIQTRKSDEFEIDLLALIKELWRRLWLIALVTVVFVIGAFCYTKYFVTPLYKASTVCYVNSNTLDISSVSLTQMNTDAKLVEGYKIVLTTRETLSAVADYAGVNYSVSQLGNMISAAAINSTGFFRVEVTSPSPEDSAAIASAVAEVLPKRISSIIEGTSVKIAEHAIVPTAPSSPSYVRNMAIGGLLGFVLICIEIVIMTLADNRITDEETLTSISKLPVLATIPVLNEESKRKYYKSGYYKKSYSKYARGSYGYGKNAKDAKPGGLIGSKLSFAGAEAYKYLRTKIQFSFVDDKPSHVIGVTSSIPGEGKSMTALNLAYSFALSKKKILLIDGDLRLPSLNKYLGIERENGLSNVLTGTNTQEKPIMMIPYRTDEPDGDSFAFMSAGDIPPNPSELLGSQKMQSVLDILRQRYEYIIIDLPPISEVSDAMIVSKIVDGMVMVVRYAVCTKPLLTESLGQFEAVDAHMIGFVFNGVASDGGKYLTTKNYKYGKYGKYGKYKKYGKYYRYSSSASTTSAKQTAKTDSETQETQPVEPKQ